MLNNIIDASSPSKFAFENSFEELTKCSDAKLRLCLPGAGVDIGIWCLRKTNGEMIKWEDNKISKEKVYAAAFFTAKTNINNVDSISRVLEYWVMNEITNGVFSLKGATQLS